MRTEDFNYDLPEELIAQEPAAVRDACRMLVMDRESGELEDRIFRDIEEYLRPGRFARGKRDARHARTPFRRETRHGRSGGSVPPSRGQRREGKALSR